MKNGIRIFFITLALALTGAPFGMGRMMDTAHQTSLITGDGQMGHTHHNKAPVHKPSTPHFVMCSACFATPVSDGLLTERLALREIVLLVPASILHGKFLLPDLPPPRA